MGFVLLLRAPGCPVHEQWAMLRGVDFVIHSETPRLAKVECGRMFLGRRLFAHPGIEAHESATEAHCLHTV
eukprot:1150028-Pelagomonas_calceolata.AAC.1